MEPMFYEGLDFQTETIDDANLAGLPPKPYLCIFIIF